MKTNKCYNYGKLRENKHTSVITTGNLENKKPTARTSGYYSRISKN